MYFNIDEFDICTNVKYYLKKKKKKYYFQN